MEILISVIIPTYKRKESLLRLLNSLKPEVNSSTEIIIVEQGVNNGKEIKQFAKENKIKWKHFFVSEIGTSYAKNIGVRNSSGKYLVFLDDDVVVKPKLINNHIKVYKDSSVGAVGGRVITKGQLIELDRDDVGGISFFGKFSDGFSSSKEQEIETVIGCNCSWRRDVFKEVRGFDESFTGAIREDSDLSSRTIKAGYRIVFEPSAVVEHLREPSGGARKTEGRIEWYFNFFSNETYFFLKHRPKIVVPLILLTRWEWMLRCMFGFGREVSLRSILTPFKGIMDGISKYRRLKTKYAYWS